jgi:hypothetical protein
MASLEIIKYLLAYINSSPFIFGIAMLFLNIGSRYIELGLSKTQEKAIRIGIARELLIFSIVFVATKDVIISILMTASFFVLSEHLFNEKSRFCLATSTLRRLNHELDLNGDNIISDDEIYKAIQILKKTKDQKKKQQQARFTSYLQNEEDNK